MSGASLDNKDAHSHKQKRKNGKKKTKSLPKQSETSSSKSITCGDSTKTPLQNFDHPTCELIPIGCEYS
jgi:hypothetical protein